MSNEIKLEGFDAFKRKLEQLPSKVTVTVGGIVQDEALRWAGLAKRSAPVNFGKLRGNITALQTGQLSAEVTSPIKYSPYVEWGTGTRVSVPVDLLNYAIQFKGLKKVLGQNPRAFFFIHREPVRKTLTARIEKYLNTQQ